MLTISTFNIQNKEDKNKIKFIKNYLIDNNIDILNLQEAYPKFMRGFQSDLKDYKVTGNYRYLYFPKINESNPIITNKKVLYSKTYNLPHLPSLLNRIITKTVVIIDNREISIYNTHLDYQYLSVKKRQLNKILKLIKKDKNPIILTGDFNLKNNKEIFNDFTEKLEKLNIYRVQIDEKTFKPSKYKRAIDHIFISKDFKLVDKNVVKDIETSDHYPVLIRVLID